MPQVDTEGFTELAMSSEIAAQQPSMPNRHGLYCEFYLEAEPDKAATLAAGHPKFKEVPYIMIMVPGDKGSVVRRPVRTGQNPEHDNNRFHNEYVAFMQQKAAPVDGMPLEEWPQVTRSQVLEMNHFGIKTVEHLSDVSDINAQKFMGLLDLRNKARAYMQSAREDGGFGKLYEELKVRDSTILDLTNTVKAMQDELKEMKEKR